MAFVTKTWKDRLVEYAGRRKLKNVATGEEVLMDVSRSEGTVSQAGDAFSAANMNNLEQRIKNEFDTLNSSLVSQPIFQYDETGKITGYKTKAGADTVFPFSSGSNYIKIEVEHNPNTGLTISEQIGKSSSLIKVATIPNINTSYKTGLCTYKRGTNSTTDTITFNVSGSYKITLNNVETVYSINAGESKTFTISRTKMTIEVTIV